MVALSQTKTWAHTNISVADGAGPTPTGSQVNADIGNRQLLYDIKATMVAGPWTVISSSGWNGASFTASASDNWSTSTGVNWDVAGEHGWIVLQCDDISSGFQICIDLNHAQTTTEVIDMWVSYASGFTGGTVSARPTATDEWQSMASVTWSNGTNGNRGASVFITADGTLTRFVTSRAGAELKLWMIEKFINVNPAWTRPYIASGALAPTFAGLASSSTIKVDTTQGIADGFMGTPVNGIGDGVDDTKLNNVDVGGNWVTPPSSLISEDSTFPAYFARFTDLWMCPTALANGDYVPSGGGRDYVVFENILMPNDGSVIIID